MQRLKQRKKKKKGKEKKGFWSMEWFAALILLSKAIAGYLSAGKMKCPLRDMCAYGIVA